MTISQGYETPLPEKFGLTYEFDKVVSSPLNVILRILIQLTVSSLDKEDVKFLICAGSLGAPARPRQRGLQCEVSRVPCRRSGDRLCSLRAYSYWQITLL